MGRTAFVFSILLSISSQGLAATQCSQQNLRPCQQANAVERKNCLEQLVRDIKACGAKVAELEVKVTDTIQAAAAKVTDPLKVEKTLILTKLEELRVILDWHHLDVKDTVKRVAGFIKYFQDDYNPMELTLSDRLTKISKQGNTDEINKLVGLRNDLRKFSEDEQARSILNESLAASFIEELEDRERFVRDRLHEYQAFLEKHDFSPYVPDFSKEKVLLTKIRTYIDSRRTKIEQATTKLAQSLYAKILSLEKNELDTACDKAFAPGRRMEQEENFYRKVDAIVVKAFQQKDVSEYHGLQYFGERHEALLEFNSLGEVCPKEQTPDDWRAWGCKRFEQYREIGKNLITSTIPRLIRNGLEMISWDENGNTTLMGAEVHKSLDAGNLPLAIQLYDRILSEVAKRKL